MSAIDRGFESKSHPNSHKSSRPAMSPAVAEDQLLFGAVALQNNSVTREALVAGFKVWVADKSRGLSEILQSQGVLSPQDCEFLQRLVEKFRVKHDGYVGQALQVLSSAAEIAPDLIKLNDPDLQAILDVMGREAAAEPVLEATQLYSGAELTNQVACDRVDGTGGLNRFRILRPHAKGGLGQVSVALDQELNREVALKELLPRHADHPSSRERFVIEAEITGGLEHPGIVPIYALGRGPDGRPFYAMRFIKGDSLKTAIEAFHQRDNPNRNDPGARHLAFRKLLGRFIDVCNAMEYAHSRGVLHRDLKPGNIMVGKYGETLVVDWGLAKAVGKKEVVSDEPTLQPSSALSTSGQTRAGSAVGTPAYMSPEQAAGKLDDLTPATDVYCLGATLYHLLTGRPPFQKENVAVILNKVQQGNLARPREVNPEVLPALEAICLKGMALRPNDRFQSARAFADDLEHWLADEPVTALPDTLGDRVSRFERKHKGYVRTGGVATVVIAIGAIAAAVVINGARKNEKEAREAAQKLATEKTQLANEKTILAASESAAKTNAEKLAEEKGLLARQNAQLAEDERKALKVTKRQLRIATAERLAASSLLRKTSSPNSSLALAVESSRATHHDDEGWLPTSQQSLLEVLTAIGGRPLTGTGRSIECLAISPEGRFVVAGSDDGLVRIWSTSSGIPNSDPRTLDHRALLNSGWGNGKIMAITSDARRIAAAVDDGGVCIWDISSEGAALAPRRLTHKADGMIRHLVISGNGRWVIAAIPGETEDIVVWDLETSNPDANRRKLSSQPASAASPPPIGRCEVSSDGHWLAVPVGNGRATARVWDLTSELSETNPRDLSGHKLAIQCVAISPDNHWLITAGFDGQVISWDLTATDPSVAPHVLSREQSGWTNVAGISPDGRWVVAGIQNALYCWDLAMPNPSEAKHVLRGHDDLITSLAFTSDSRSVVSGSRDHTARVWDLNAPEPARSSRVLRGHSKAISEIARSTDCRWCVTSSQDGAVRLWDLMSPSQVANPRIFRNRTAAFQGTVVTADSRRLIAVSGGPTALVWELTDRGLAREPRVLSGHNHSIFSIASSADSRWIVTGASDGTARLWDMDADNPSATARVLGGHEGAVTSVAISPDNRWAATWSAHRAGGSENTARVWDLQNDDSPDNPRTLKPEKAGVASVVFSRDARWLVTTPVGNSGFSSTGSFHASVWDLRSNHLPSSVRTVPWQKAASVVVSISPESSLCAIGLSDGTIHLIDLRGEALTANRRILSGADGAVNRLLFSADNTLLVGWQSTGGLAVNSISGRDVEYTIAVWDLMDQTHLNRPRVLSGHRGQVTTAAISSDNRWLVTGSWDQTARVWDLATANPSANPRILTGHDGSTGPIAGVHSVAVSADGKWIITAGWDDTLRVWRWQWHDLEELARQFGENLSIDEWNQSFPGESYRQTFFDPRKPGGQPE